MRTAAILLLCACARGFDIPSAANRTAGTACEQSGQCISGACVDGVCCAKQCAAAESCAVAGQLGACAPRPAGAACAADAQCPGGHCADGVCCENACSGTCMTCQADATHAAGTCHLALDDTDLRKDCGLCSACFQGICAPSTPGTDPNQRCPAGQVCGPSQACGEPGGATCATDADCAVGSCFGGACEQLSVEHVFVDPMVASATGRNPRAVAASEGGAVAILFGEFSEDTTGSGYAENDLFIALRSPQGAWTAVDLFTDLGSITGGQIGADVAFVGPTAFVLAYNIGVSDSSPCAPQPNSPCGVFGMLVSPGGQVGRPEAVDPGVSSTSLVRLLRDDQGRLIAAYDGIAAGGNQLIRLRRRDVTATSVTWTPIATIDTGFTTWSDVSWDAALSAGAPVVFVANQSTNDFLAFTGAATPDRATLPASAVACSPLFPRAARLDAQTELLGINCSEGPVTGTWDATHHFNLADLAAATRADPLGSVGGASAFMVFRDSQGTPVVNDVHVDLRRASGDSDRLVFHPRGTDDVTAAWSTVGADGLPLFSIVTGHVSSDPNAATVGIDLYLARYHP